MTFEIAMGDGSTRMVHINRLKPVVVEGIPQETTEEDVPTSLSQNLGAEDTHDLFYEGLSLEGAPGIVGEVAGDGARNAESGQTAESIEEEQTEINTSGGDDLYAGVNLRPRGYQRADDRTETTELATELNVGELSPSAYSPPDDTIRDPTYTPVGTPRLPCTRSSYALRSQRSRED